MRKYYVLCSLAVIAIIILQSFYIGSLYNQYIDSESSYIDDRIYEAIDLERHYRSVRKNQANTPVEFHLDLIQISKMSDKTRDSLLAIQPLPKKPLATLADTYDIVGLMNDGVVRSAEEVKSHQNQDLYYEKGNPINTDILDSLLHTRLKINYGTQIEVRNSEDSLISKTGDLPKFNYTSKRVQIGFKGYQFLTVWADISLSTFIKHSIWGLILSLVIISVPLISILYLLTTLRYKQSILEYREHSTNGIIHDLKSPLSSLSTMLSLFKIMEKNPEKQKLIAANSTSITRLIKKIEQLLEVNRHSRSKIIVCKKPIMSNDLTQYAVYVKDTLLITFQNKYITININNLITPNQLLYIDTMYLDTALNILMENSAKYSGDNVKINVLFELSAPNKLTIRVKDNGIGIDKKHLRYIFKQFYRINETTIKGYGIGLSYLRMIAQAHGGNVSAMSELHRGSEFELTLNCEKNE